VPPELRTIEALLARVRRRIDLRASAQGAAVGVGVVAVATLVGWPSHPLGALAAGIAAGIAGVLIRVLSTRSAVGPVALFVERNVPASRNVIATAHELGDDTTTAYVRALVLNRAAQVARTVDVGQLVPLRTALIALASALGVWLFATVRAGAPTVSPIGSVSAAVTAPTLDAVDVAITPPAYAGRSTVSLHDPARIEALAGSRITITARGRATAVALETVTSRDTLVPRGAGEFTSTLIAAADGYFSLEPRTGTRVGARRLIGLTVVPDLAPRVTITTPGHDVRLPDGRRSLDIAVEANDDIGLASLRLHYTKVSGSGERFTFSEGDVPLTVARSDRRGWSGRVTWKLDPLELGPGDMVVYRAIAADQRPNAAPSESDSYIAEVTSAGGVAAAGFAVDPEQDRYAVSQQMVILKTERLLARRASMKSEDYENEALELAAEQRKVRAEFVFMLGGELADAPDVAASMTEINEAAEAEGESDILAGRNANAGHVALLRAIRSMSRAAASLTVADLGPALPHERAALTQLESAFSHTRILLRALSTRERLDLSRRLTGVLTDAVRERHPSVEPQIDERGTRLRRALADLASIAGAPTFNDSIASEASLVAERVLRVAAAARPLQDVAQLLSDAGRAIAARQSETARTLLDRAATQLVAVLRGNALDAPGVRQSTDDARLAGALRDAARRGERP
jgi:hypothetical protein